MQNHELGSRGAAILDEALKLEEPERSVFIERICSNDKDLLRYVSRLLSEFHRADDAALTLRC
jgi:hypothetical protein